MALYPGRWNIYIKLAALSGSYTLAANVTEDVLSHVFFISIHSLHLKLGMLTSTNEASEGPDMPAI